MTIPATWFYDHGVGVFPLRDRSKEPACRWKAYRGTRAQVERFQNYGVRLGLLAVVDADTRETTAWVQTQIDLDAIPLTPLIVKTSRGLHLYYRLASSDGIPKFIHRDGLTIEFRHAGQYVVGPGSIHPSGAIYTACDWSWRWEDIPRFDTARFLFDDGSCGRRSNGERGDPYEFPALASKGERHAELFKLLRSMKGLGAEKVVAREAVSLANANRCQPPLAEDHTFEAWFDRAWHLPNQALKMPFAAEIPDLLLEAGPAVDLDAVDLEDFYG